MEATLLDCTEIQTSLLVSIYKLKCQYFIITILLQGVQEWAEVINAGNIKDLFMDRGLESVNLNSLKRLWRISGQVNNVESTSLFPVSFFLLLPNSLFINPLSILLNLSTLRLTFRTTGSGSRLMEAKEPTLTQAGSVLLPCTTKSMEATTTTTSPTLFLFLDNF